MLPVEQWRYMTKHVCVPLLQYAVYFEHNATDGHAHEQHTRQVV
jgi:hypothetical protein